MKREILQALSKACIPHDVLTKVNVVKAMHKILEEKMYELYLQVNPFLFNINDHWLKEKKKIGEG
jgi:hypothetical protein